MNATIYTTASSTPAVSTPIAAPDTLLLIDQEEINLIRRYRQARAQGMMLMIDADSGTLRMCGRAEQLRRR